MSNESAQTVSETISSSGSGSSDETVSQKANDLFDYMLTKSLALCGMIALICVIILLIFIVIYCIIKKKKQRAVQSESTFGLSSIMKDKSKPNSRHFEFKKLQNTSSMGNVNVSEPPPTLSNITSVQVHKIPSSGIGFLKNE